MPQFKSFILQILANISTSPKDNTLQIDEFSVRVLNNNSHIYNSSKNEEEYDSDGAVWFVVATILIYALSIMIMIGANLSRSLADDEVKNFLKSYTTLNIKKCEKIKVKTVLTNKGIQIENMFDSTPSTPELAETIREEDECELEEDSIDVEAKRSISKEVKRKWFTRGFSFPIREESFDFDDSNNEESNSMSSPAIHNSDCNG